MVQGLIPKTRLTFAQWRLFRCISKNRPTKGIGMDDVVQQSLRRAITNVRSGEANKLRKFIEQHIETHSHIVLSVMQVFHQQNNFTHIRQTIDHFQYAVDLGWNYADCAFRMIHEAFVETGHMNLTLEQERALIVLEDSRWEKDYTVHGGMMRGGRKDDPCVAQAVIERPHDVQRIIELANMGSWSRVAQIESMLDGSTTKVLSEGAL